MSNRSEAIQAISRRRLLRIKEPSEQPRDETRTPAGLIIPEIKLGSPQVTRRQAIETGAALVGGLILGVGARPGRIRADELGDSEDEGTGTDSAKDPNDEPASSANLLEAKPVKPFDILYTEPTPPYEGEEKKTYDDEQRQVHNRRLRAYNPNFYGLGHPAMMQRWEELQQFSKQRRLTNTPDLIELFYVRFQPSFKPWVTQIEGRVRPIQYEVDANQNVITHRIWIHYPHIMEPHNDPNSIFPYLGIWNTLENFTRTREEIHKMLQDGLTPVSAVDQVKKPEFKDRMNLEVLASSLAIYGAVKPNLAGLGINDLPIQQRDS